MIPLSIFLDGDNCWPELKDHPKIISLMGDAAAGAKLAIAVLPRGMGSGRPSVTLRIDLPDGSVVLTETSARLFCTAARAILGRYPDLFEGD